MHRLGSFLILLLLGFGGMAQEMHRGPHWNRLELIPNQGQFHPAVRFMTPLPNGHLYLRSDGFTFDLYHMEDYHAYHAFRHEYPLRTDYDGRIRKHAVSFRFLGMEHSPRSRAIGAYSHYYNYFIGNRPDNWASEVHPCREVHFLDAYPGVDLEVLAGEGLKYQWRWKDAAEYRPDQIRIAVDGVDSLGLDEGRLLVHTSVGTIVEDAPFAFQQIGSELRPIQCSYEIEGHTVSYRIHTELIEGYPLVIDPSLIFSTYSGSVGDNFGYTATYDSKGNLYAGGIVDNQGSYPVTTGSYDQSWNGGQGRRPVNLPCDISISKYSNTGQQLLWATYLGGTDDEYPHSLVVDAADRLIVMGTTHSANYPYHSGAYDSTFNGGFDIIVSKFSEDGSQLLGSTFVGGTSDDGLNRSSAPLRYNYADDFRGDVLPDVNSNILVSSCTQSENMPLVNQHAGVLQGNQDAYLFELNEDLSQLNWATYFGGSGTDAAYSIKLDRYGHIFIGGGTTSSDLPGSDTTFSPDWSGGVDGFIASFRQQGKQFMDLSYFGSPNYDQIYFIELDTKGAVYATGQSKGQLSKTPGTYGQDGMGQFIFKTDTAFQNIQWQTTFGNTFGQTNLAPSAFLVDICDHIYFSGWGSQIQSNVNGSTTGMEVTSDAAQPTTDNNDFYVLVLDKDASNLLYATYFGGDSTADHVDGGTSRFDKRGVIYQSVCASCPPPAPGTIATQTSQVSDFPVTSNAVFQSNPSVRCSNASFKIDLQIKSAVIAEFLTMPPIGCGPLTVDFTNRSTFGKSFFWEFGDDQFSTDTHPTHTYNESGVYRVKLTVVDSNTCNISDTYERNIVVLAKGTAAFTAEYRACSDELLLTNTSEGALRYLWDFGNGEGSEEETPVHRYGEEGTYTIRLIINPGDPCADTAFQIVEIQPFAGLEFKLYNAFSPNQDQYNECFHFEGLEQFCEGIEWKVYNRWGELLFETTDPTACWDGNLPNGTPVPEGTYFYILDLDPESVSSDSLISGTVELFR